MKLISWNIDGAKTVLRRCDFSSLLWMWQADVFAFQETKVLKSDTRLKFPGYHEYWSFFDTCTNQNVQSGTVCFTKEKAKTFSTKFADECFDTEGRLITLEFEHYYFVNVYVPNSQDDVAGRSEIKSVQRRDYRRRFDQLLYEHLKELNMSKPVIVCGDFNAAISSADMSANSRWQDGADGFSKAAGDRLKKLTESGFTDTYRLKHPKTKRAYTHWSVRDKNRDTSPGRRLDYFFVSDELAENVEDADIHSTVYGSDHSPIYLKINMSPSMFKKAIDFNLTYEDFLAREKSGLYYHSLQEADLTKVWDSVDWDRAKGHLLEMQCALSKAAYSGDADKIRALQYKIVRSLDSKLLAVRAVTSRKGTAGIDNVKWETSDEKIHAAISLTSKDYNARPARRVEKEMEDGKSRNIHVDTYYDRAMRALYGYSLAPVAEAWSDRKSFSNRKNRSTFDANYYICKIFSGEDAPLWAVKTDVKKCYESIDHDWIRKNIPMASRVLNEFLSAGYFFSDKYYHDNHGIGIGSRLSPFLANMSMDGLQEYIYDRVFPGRGNDDIDYDNGNMVRYADDIIVSARDRQTAVRIRSMMYDFMRARGLMLSDEKTQIVYVPNGFDFLKRTYRKHGDYLIASPSEETVIHFKNKIGEYIKHFKGSQERLISELNKRITGFVSYHRMTDAYDTFREMDAFIRLCLYKLCEERCPTWSRERINETFWYVDDRRRPTYALKEAPYKHVLFMADTVPIRYTPIPLHYNPYIDYEKIEEITNSRDIENVNGKYKKIWVRQGGLCAYCGEEIKPDEERQLIEVNPSEENFNERMGYIHCRCNSLEFDFDDAEYSDKDRLKELLVELSDEYLVDDIEDNPLYQFFKNADKSTITLSFKKIGEILGTPLSNIANEREFWIQDADEKLCRCWLDNEYFVKRVSVSGRKQVTFHKFRFPNETARVDIPDLLIHGKVPLRMKMRIEAMLRHEFEMNGISWE